MYKTKKALLFSMIFVLFFSVNVFADGAKLPNAASHFTAKVQKDGSVTVSWDKVSNAESYTLERSMFSDTGYEVLSSALTECRYVDYANGDYPYYRLTAQNANGSGVRQVTSCTLQMTEKKRINVGDIVNDVCISGEYMYTAESEKGFGIYRETDNGYDRLRYVKENQTSVEKILIHGKYLYAASFAPTTNNCQLRLYDVSVPEKPVFVEGMVLSGGGGIKSMDIKDGKLFVTTGTMYIFDLTYPGRLISVGRLANVNCMCEDGGITYVAASDKVSAYDISNINRPGIYGSFDFYFEKLEKTALRKYYRYINGIAAKNGYVAVFGKYGPQIVDFTNKNNPKPTTDYKKNMFLIEDTNFSVTVGNFVFISENAKKNLRMYNIANLKEGFIPCRSFFFGDTVKSVRCTDDNIIICAGSAGIIIYER